MSSPPPQLFFDIKFPPFGQPVPLTFEIRGNISWLFVPGNWVLADRHVYVRFGPDGPLVEASFDTTTDWHCVGQMNPVHRGGFVDISVDAQATFLVDNVSPVVLTKSSGIKVQVFRSSPGVTIDDFHPPLIAPQLPLTFTFTGTAASSEAPLSLVQYKVENGQFANAVNVSGNWTKWQVTLPLPPGTHELTIRATDQFGSVGERSQSFDVQPETPIEVPPGARTTLSGVPTTSSVTSWTRLEPQCTDADMGVSAAARAFDPLWLLTRQWQMGEFQAEDAGTPVQARVRATNAMLSRYAPGELPLTAAGASPAARYDPKAVPLEVLVEQRPMRPSTPTDLRMLRFAIDAGLHFLRMLEEQPISQSYREQFATRLALEPIDPALTKVDDATLRYARSMAGRAPDGRRLADILRTLGAAKLVQEPALGIVPGDRAEVQQAATDWLGWYDALFHEPTAASGDGWNASRLEYALAVGGRLSAAEGGDVTLSATAVDGPIDWSSFDVDRSVSLTPLEESSAVSIVETAIPAPVGFPGAPSPRFWEMEDAHVAYGLVPVGPTDLGQLLMIEYVSSYGNDWFAIPLVLPIGSLTRVDSLVVTDTFGIQTLLRPIGDPALKPAFFSLWQSSIRRPAELAGNVMTNLFFLPPTLGRTLDGTALEDVLFMRDEMANLAWAIERTLESPLERAVSRTDAPEPSSAEEPPSPRPHYQLASPVAANWIPLLPKQQRHPQAPNQIIVLLERGAVLQPDGSEQVNEARGEILNARGELRLFDEEVPREGVHVTRRRRLARWTDGSTWLWTALRSDVGRGEGGSGLRFDQVLEPEAADAGSND